MFVDSKMIILNIYLIMPIGNNEIVNFLPCSNFFEEIPKRPERISGLTFFFTSELVVKGYTISN